MLQRFLRRAMQRVTLCCCVILLLAFVLVFSRPADVAAGDHPHPGLGLPPETYNSGHRAAAARGYRVLRTKPFLPPDFDAEVFENLWRLWPEPLRTTAESATPQERRQMAFSRYGLMEPPGEDAGTGWALGYVDDGKGGWVMNCLACHAGKVAGRVIPGLPNTHIALQTLTEDVRLTKLTRGKPFSHLDLGSFSLPLGGSDGTTNSVVFGVVLGALRDADMKVDRSRPVPVGVHHDMDAPPLWNVKKKSRLYCDGFAPKNHRVLMQFMLIPENDAETVMSWEDDFRDILAWIESLQPPRYSWSIDRDLANRGKQAFVAHCSRCHGTYGNEGKYEQKTIPIDVVGTDPVRLNALTNEARRRLQESWMSHYGRDPVVIDPVGYVAPPLHGIWATAPYFHNGSVPTLWHVLHPDQRPIVWKRTENGYDRSRVGLEIAAYGRLPDGIRRPSVKRQFFDTRRRGKSAAGHRFPDRLKEEEKRAVLEYLKTL